MFDGIWEAGVPTHLVLVWYAKCREQNEQSQSITMRDSLVAEFARIRAMMPTYTVDNPDSGEFGYIIVRY